MPETEACYWRIKPNAYVEHHVQRIAKAEARSLSNTLRRLLTEAIDARRAADNNVSRLAALLTAVVTEQSPT
jgi:hypothetical protein